MQVHTAVRNAGYVVVSDREGSVSSEESSKFCRDVALRDMVSMPAYKHIESKYLTCKHLQAWGCCDGEREELRCETGIQDYGTCMWGL